MGKETQIHSADNDAAPPSKKAKAKAKTNGVDSKAIKAAVATWEKARDARETAEQAVENLRLEESRAIAVVVDLAGSGPHAYKGGRLKFMVRNGVWFTRGANTADLPELG